MSIIRSSLLLGAGDGAAGGLQVSRSLRFNSADSAYLNRTPASAGNRKTWTWSGWAKRAKFGNYEHIFAGTGSSPSYAQFYWSPSEQLVFDNGGSGAITTTQVFRDTSAWYHIVLIFDTTQGTAADRMRMYVNGSQITSFSSSSYPSQDSDGGMNQASIHYIGKENVNYSNFYLANIHFIDGQALTPASFAETDATTGQWIPKAYTGSYGQVSVAAASGALPVWNTTDTYGATKGSGTRTDANSASIVLALPMDGTNGGTSFGDQSATIKGSGSAKTVTVNGNTNTSTAQSKFYGSSAYFDGAGDYLTLGSSADFAFGTGDFTIEAFVYRPSGGGLQIFDHLMGVGNFTIFSYSNQAITVYSNAAYSSGVNPGNDRWFHLAVVRSSGVLSFFIDGVKAANTYSFTLNMTTAGVNIGSSQYSEYGTQYLQDLRVYKGLAKYTANFSPVTISNSFYLQFADNSSNTASTLGKDYSGLGNNWTPNNLSVGFSVTQNYSTTTSGTPPSPYNSNRYLQAFDGDLSTAFFWTPGTWAMTWTSLPSAVTVSSTLRVYSYPRLGTITVNINGSNVASITGDTWGWRTISFTGTINTISFTGTDFYSGVYAIEVDGAILIDPRANSVNDSLVDSPTNYGTDTGVGGEVRGNYATLNPLNIQLGAGSLSNGNLDFTGPSGSSAYNFVGGTFGIDTSTSTGWYFEYTQTTYGQFASIALLDQSVSASALNNLYIIGHSFANQTAGISYINGGALGNYGTLTTGLTSWTSNGDVIGVAIKDNKIWFAKNNTWISGSPSAGTSPSITLASTKFVTPAAIGINSSVLSLNAGQRAFAYTAPSGYKALCTQNLPEGTITTSGTYTGNGVADGPFVYLNGVPTAMTVGGNAVTFGTHADKLSNGFKLRTTSTTYNQNALSYSYSITTTGAKFKYARAQPNP